MDVIMRNLQIFGFIILEEAGRNYMTIEKRTIRDSKNPFEIPDAVFKNLFRLDKPMAFELINSLEPHYRARISHNAIPFPLKVLAALFLYANGSYQNPVGSSVYSCMSQPSISRIIYEVSILITRHLMPQHVKFPILPEEVRSVKSAFYERTGFRGIVGAIDGTHIDIIAPPKTDLNHPPFVYINRKGKHSINVMLICDSNMRILAVNARFPGSVHDSAIWQMSNIRNHMQILHQGGHNNYLIGDSGYPLEPWLLTPFLNPQNEREEQFNRGQRRTRNVIERVNGVLKNKFRCLSGHRALCYHPARAAFIIYACVVLYNISLHINFDIENNVNPDDYNENFADPVDNMNLQVGMNERHNYMLNNQM